MASEIEPPAGRSMGATLRANIKLLEDRRRRETTQAGPAERIARAIGDFAGSMRFVLVHALLFGFWLAANRGWLPGVPRFDPTFLGLSTTASVEAIFLSAFVLITQNRMAAAGERRADLDLHISLLAEHELTRLAALTERIADRLGLRNDDPAFAEVKQDVEPAEVLDTLDAVKSSDA